MGCVHFSVCRGEGCTTTKYDTVQSMFVSEHLDLHCVVCVCVASISNSRIA